MARKRDIESPPREVLEALRREGNTRDDIALLFKVSLSRVKRWLKEQRDAENEAHDAGEDEDLDGDCGEVRGKAGARRSASDDDGLPLMERVRLILGPRMTEDYRGYLLDNRPVRIGVLVTAAGLSMPDIP